MFSGRSDGAARGLVCKRVSRIQSHFFITQRACKHQIIDSVVKHAVVMDSYNLRGGSLHHQL
jgi:hypothetical protein